MWGDYFHFSLICEYHFALFYSWPLNNMRRPCTKPCGAPKNTTYSKLSTLIILSTKVHWHGLFHRFSLLSLSGSQVNFSPVVFQHELKSKEVNLSVLCYLSIFVAVALQGSHDRILMGRFSPVPSIPPSLRPSSHPHHPIPFCTPMPLCRTKSWNPWWRGAV